MIKGIVLGFMLGSFTCFLILENIFLRKLKEVENSGTAAVRLTSNQCVTSINELEQTCKIQLNARDRLISAYDGAVQKATKQIEANNEKMNANNERLEQMLK